MEQKAVQDDSFFDSREALTRFLFLRDEPAPVDLCFVLGCPAVSSMQPAVDLYSMQLAKRILVSGHGPLAIQEPECEVFKAYAVARGVPEADIFLERRATNTLENFVFSSPIIENEFGWNNIRSAAIVGKPFHMRRALMTARMHWPSHLRLIMQPSSHPDDLPADTWWKTEVGRRYVLAEVRAIGEYALEGHIGGF